MLVTEKVSKLWSVLVESATPDTDTEATAPTALLLTEAPAPMLPLPRVIDVGVALPPLPTTPVLMDDCLTSLKPNVTVSEPNEGTGSSVLKALTPKEATAPLAPVDTDEVRPRLPVTVTDEEPLSRLLTCASLTARWVTLPSSGNGSASAPELSTAITAIATGVRIRQDFFMIALQGSAFVRLRLGGHISSAHWALAAAQWASEPASASRPPAACTPLLQRETPSSAHRPRRAPPAR